MKHFFISMLFLLGAWLVTSSSAFAAEERLIAVVMANSQQRYQDIHAVFVENSQPFCGDSCKIYVQTPNADNVSLRNSVRKAVALGADLIVTYGSSATLAAKAESRKIPTLFADVYDPALLGIVETKSQTGRNMTGVRGDAPIQALFKYFVETIKPKKLVVLYDIKNLESRLQKTALVDSGRKREITIVPLAIARSQNHLVPLQTLPQDVDSLFLTNDEDTEFQLSQVLSFASSRQLPVITQRAGTAEAGAFMVLETSAVEQGEMLAAMAEQVFSGKKVSEIPVHKPRQVAFVVNLKVAKEYGILVPIQTLSLASRVVR